MSRYRGPKLRIVRRLGSLPGLTDKISKNTKTPGQHGKELNDSSKKPTEYGLRLEEKQKLKFNYGITESQLFKYLKEARRRKGVTSLILLQLLEMRLDAICFTLRFGKSIAQTRQLINHGHITVNHQIVSIPSFQCKVNDVIGIKTQSISINLIQSNIKNYQNNSKFPMHLEFDNIKNEAKVVNYCMRDDIALELNELLVIEYYSRR